MKKTNKKKTITFIIDAVFPSLFLLLNKHFFQSKETLQYKGTYKGLIFFILFTTQDTQVPKTRIQTTLT